ncbi:10283_t:CDS:1 [Entrophospora sp. SA101]|nr:10283_t:CDS:1 [Entrophospora sp. SA101]
MNPEQRDKEKSNLIAKLEYDVSLIKEENLQDKNMNSVSEEIPVSFEINSDNTSKQIVSQSEDAPVSDISNDAPNSEIKRPIRTDPNSLEDKAVDDFLDLVGKESVSNMMKERNRDKKIQQEMVIHDSSNSSSE